MTDKLQDFRQAIHRAWQQEQPVWSPDCPEPETLLDWVEQDKAHPQTVMLLDHVLSCAYCRQEYAALREIRALALVPDKPRRVATRIAKIEAWVQELVTEGITTPIRSLRATLASLDRLAESYSLAAVRSLETPTDLRPAFTAIRTPQPTLSWAVSKPASEYVVLVERREGRKKRRLVWRSSAAESQHLTLPEQAGLEPGVLYVWQVIARLEHQDYYSPSAWFVVLTEAARGRLESLEQQTEDSTLERVSLYEAYGLYDEARQKIETLLALRPDDSVVRAVYTKLLQRLAS